MPPQRSPLRTRFDQFLLNESPRIVFLSFWSLLQFLIFYFSFEIYNRSTHYSQARAKLGFTLGVAKGSAAVINFDCGVILLSVCRNLISVLRSTFLNGVVPFDKNVLFHKTVAWSIVLFSVVHSAGHYVNYYRLEQAEQRENGEVKKSAQYMALFTGPGFTGHVLMLILFLMVTSSVERVRRKGFETFWYTHHLFILFFLTLMYHGAFCFIRADTPPYCKSSPTSYKFVLGSLFFYILERTIREFRARLPATSISKIVLHPSKVLEVQIKKPNNRQGDSSFFRTKAGQYIFLNCPDISAFEWHPFTITSAPEEDYVSVHIRIVGDWTTAFARRLGCSFDDEQQFWIEELRNRSMGGEMEMAGVDGGIASASSTAVATDSMAFGSGTSLSGTKSRVNPSASTNSMQFHTPPDPPIITLPRVLLDGPYGSPSEDAFNYEIAVLVGAGIGVTPFASVLKHIWYSVMQPTKIITLRKVYFFWVCRDRDAFEWFQDLLIALEEQNLSDFLEIRSYLTGELGKEELDTVLMEARASAAAAAARHFRSKHYGGGGGVHQGQVVEGEEGEEGDLLTTPQVPLDGSGAFPIEVMLGEEFNGSNETLSDARDRDAITGLRSPTYYGRPNFDKIFGELALAHPREHGQVGVFFCGPKPLGKTLHRCARKYKFEFHKENF
ncbi:hypothetical protein EC957_009984 [Mortierella hygrophila]|uniref:FAD-binding FR-type domain-containing protein n=1 Tax=Mortierella hygrophila TaxID=979708 RepID=A0A9P6FB12_9FUNG|nr:hypothetical protein EC957_009984 [Mortierella hygrophila]